MTFGWACGDHFSNWLGLFQLSETEVCPSERTVLAICSQRSVCSGQRRGFLCRFHLLNNFNIIWLYSYQDSQLEIAMNEYDQSMEISQLIKQRKAELEGIDQELMEELARQKILEELMGDGSSRQQRSYENSERTNRMEDSGISELSSIGTQEVVDELEKLKMLSNFYKMAHGLPVEQTKASLQYETVPSFTKTHQKKRPKRQMNHKKQQQTQQKEIELRELTQQDITHEFANFRKTINKIDQQQKQLDKLATLKQQWRQTALAEERYMIRQQLISEQKAKQKQSQQKQGNYAVKIHENRSNWLAQPSLLTNPTLKHQRQLKFKSLLGQLGGANRRADRIRDQIRTSSFMR